MATFSDGSRTGAAAGFPFGPLAKEALSRGWITHDVVGLDLQRAQVLRQFRAGALTRADISDAHPHLLNSAEVLGSVVKAACPICGRSGRTGLHHVYWIHGVGVGVVAATARSQRELPQIVDGFVRAHVSAVRGSEASCRESSEESSEKSKEKLSEKPDEKHSDRACREEQVTLSPMDRPTTEPVEVPELAVHTVEVCVTCRWNTVIRMDNVRVAGSQKMESFNLGEG